MRRRRARRSSRRRRCSGGRSRSSASSSPASRSRRRSCSRSRISTGPTRPRSCSSSSCSRSPRRRRCCWSFAAARRDHPSWSLREHAGREFPHLLREIDLGPLGDADGELLAALVAPATLPAELERRVLEAADGNPFFLEELVRSLADVGALVRTDDGWRFDHAVEVEVPPTVEKAILARLDRLSVAGSRPRHRCLRARATFALPLLEGVLGDVPPRFAPRAAATRPAPPEPALAAAGVPLSPCAHPGDGVSDAARRAADPPAPAGGGVARGAVRAARYRGAGPARAPLAAGRGRGEGGRRTCCVPATRHDTSMRSTRRSSTTVTSCRCSSSAASGRRSRSSSSSSRSPSTRRCASPRRTRPTSARSSTGRRPSPRRDRAAAHRHELPPERPRPVRDRLAEHPACMQLFDRLVEAWPERTIVPSLAERWEISDDGLRYVFHLRDGLVWSDGTPLTAHDVEFGIKRVLDPEAPAPRSRSTSRSRTVRTRTSAATPTGTRSACGRSTTGRSSSG